MTDNLEYICDVCSGKVEYSKMPIQCDSCAYWYHGKCEKLSKKEWVELGNSNTTWNCKNCAKSIFPFYCLDDEEFQECVHNVTSKMKDLIETCLGLESDVKQYYDGNYFNTFTASNYLTHEQLSRMSVEIENSFSLVHFNCRSLKSNFDDIENLLYRCNANFKVIGLSETWMNDEKGDDYEKFYLNGYTVHYINRKNKKGGGAALFVKDSVKQKTIDELTYSIDNCFDVVTVEIKDNKSNVFLVSCIYRPPNTNMNVFIESYTIFFT